MTLQLDAQSTALFERHRQTFFPPALNQIPAHLTLFHKLPGEDLDAIVRTAARVCPRRPFPVAISHLMPLGRGVAYAVTSPALNALRASLADAFAPTLTGQDRQRFRPHITVQNKVAPPEARRTLDLLARTFAPFEATAEGLQLWHYLGGPWSPAGALPFTP